MYRNVRPFYSKRGLSSGQSLVAVVSADFTEVEIIGT